MQYRHALVIEHNQWLIDVRIDGDGRRRRRRKEANITFDFELFSEEDIPGASLNEKFPGGVERTRSAAKAMVSLPRSTNKRKETRAN